MFVASGAEQVGWLTGVLLEGARGGAEWVLWLLVAMSVLSVAVFVERLVFLRRSAADTQAIRSALMERLTAGDVDGALAVVEQSESMQARVVAYGLRDAERGPNAVTDLCRGAIGMEKLRYDRGVSVLGTVGANAPFVGLFGTVMGVIMAFDHLRFIGDSAPDASNLVMGAIAEALIATGVGLLVAIPAIIFYNLLRSRIKAVVAETNLLVETTVALLRHDSTGR